MNRKESPGDESAERSATGMRCMVHPRLSMHHGPQRVEEKGVVEGGEDVRGRVCRRVRRPGSVPQPLLQLPLDDPCEQGEGGLEGEGDEGVARRGRHGEHGKSHLNSDCRCHLHDGEGGPRATAQSALHAANAPGVDKHHALQTEQTPRRPTARHVGREKQRRQNRSANAGDKEPRQQASWTIHTLHKRAKLSEVVQVAPKVPNVAMLPLRGK
mmetsp:Transcript_41662/g.97993  ORF Transcript_41662/g.97993 Transcript_41662/m.97993 type:complete len:213 (-) Transcript_41662:271-909(-)